MIRFVVECDNCKVQEDVNRPIFLQTPSLPPGWITVQDHESVAHYCSGKCLIEKEAKEV